MISEPQSADKGKRKTTKSVPRTDIEGALHANLPETLSSTIKPSDNATQDSVKESSSISPISQPTIQDGLKNPRRFQIALSFPGEQRDLIGQIAERLAETYGREAILYDEYHRAEFARPNLDVHLQKLYRNDSDLIIIFICADYQEKTWCGIEWRAIRNLLHQNDTDERIMFVKCGEGVVDGVFGTIDGYIDSNKVSIDDIIADILKRHVSLCGQEQKTAPSSNQRVPSLSNHVPTKTIVDHRNKAEQKLIKNFSIVNNRYLFLLIVLSGMILFVLIGLYHAYRYYLQAKVLPDIALYDHVMHSNANNFHFFEQYSTFENVQRWENASRYKIPEGDFLFGSSLYYGNFLRKNKHEGIALIKRAANNGFPQAQNNMGMYLTQWQDDKAKTNITEGILWFRKAANQNYSLAMFNLAECLKEQDNKESLEWLNKAVELSNPQAMYALSKRFLEGDGIDQDIQRGIELLSNAAETGCAQAQNDMGFYYLTEQYVEKDERKAFLLFQKSADQGLDMGIYHLAVCYANGFGIAKDMDMAKKLHEKSKIQYSITRPPSE